MAAAATEDDDIVSGINVTPLVDVCLVLVIIFMVTAPIMSDPVIKVDLPKAHTQEGQESDKVILTLGKDGQVAVEYQIYPTIPAIMNGLREKLMESQSKVVILRADKDALNGQLLDLMAAAKEAGAESLTIATQQERGQ